jgi:hypothetical protein
MPPLVIAGAIAGTAAIGSAVISSHATSKAVKAQTAATTANNNLATANRDYQYNLNAPSIQGGAAADKTIAGLLNIGGDQAASEAALGQFRDTGGYQELMRTGLASVNSNAYARGMGHSGATYKALMSRATNIADSSRNGYIANLTDVANRGAQGRGLVAGVGTNTVNTITANNNNQATTVGNAALSNASNLTGTLQNLINAGAYAYGSSYGAPRGR